MVNQFKFFQEPKPIRWRTANGLTHPLHTISIDHIVSIVRCMNGSGDRTIPNPYEGRTHAEWINIFHNEMERRRDENREPNPTPVQIRDVAVVCSSLQDFDTWKRNLLADVTEEGDLNYTFVRNNARYIAVTSIDSIRGRCFDDVIYTESIRGRLDIEWVLNIQRRR